MTSYTCPLLSGRGCGDVILGGWVSERVQAVWRRLPYMRCQDSGSLDSSRPPLVRSSSEASSGHEETAGTPPPPPPPLEPPAPPPPPSGRPDGHRVGWKAVYMFVL